MSNQVVVCQSISRSPLSWNECMIIQVVYRHNVAGNDKQGNISPLDYTYIYFQTRMHKTSQIYPYPYPHPNPHPDPPTTTITPPPPLSLSSCIYI